MTPITELNNLPTKWVSRRGVLWLLGFIGAATPILIYMWAFLRYSVNMPAGDDYDAVLDWLGRFIDSGTIVEKFRLIFEQHNEHRIVFDRLIFLADYAIAGKINFIYLDVVGALGLFLIFFLLVRIARKSRIPNISVLVLALLVFNLRQWGLISFAMASIQQYWQLLFAMISLYLLRTCQDKSRLIASIMLAVASIFTGAGGLLTFPIGILYLIVCEKGSRAIVAWAVVGVAAFLVYFVILPYHGTTISKQSHELLFANPLKALYFILAFLGGYMRKTTPAILLGGLSLIAFMTILFSRMRSGLFKDSAFMATLIGYIILVAIASGISRSEIGLGEALSSRYTIYGLTLLALLYIYGLSGARTWIGNKAIISLGCIASIVLYVSYFWSSIGFLRFENSLQERYIVYPYNARAIDILGEGMRAGYFFPVAIVFSNLPERAKTGLSYKYPIPYSVDSMMPAPAGLKQEILSSCEFYRSWVWLSDLYFHHNDLKLAYPLNTMSSYRDFLDWAATYSDATSPYKLSYSALSGMVGGGPLDLSAFGADDSVRGIGVCGAAKVGL